MKKIILLCVIGIFLSMNANAKAAEEKKCSEIEGSKKLGKNSGEYMKCLGKTVRKKTKLKTDSKLTRWITGKDKITDSIPNPYTRLKNIGKAIKPDLK